MMVWLKWFSRWFSGSVLIFQGVIYNNCILFHNETIVNAPTVQSTPRVTLGGHGSSGSLLCCSEILWAAPEKIALHFYTMAKQKCLYCSQPLSFLVDGQGLHSLDKYVDFDALRALVEQAEGEEGGYEVYWWKYPGLSKHLMLIPGLLRRVGFQWLQPQGSKGVAMQKWHQASDVGKRFSFPLTIHPFFVSWQGLHCQQRVACHRREPMEHA